MYTEDFILPTLSADPFVPTTYHAIAVLVQTMDSPMTNK